MRLSDREQSRGRGIIVSPAGCRETRAKEGDIDMMEYRVTIIDDEELSIEVWDKEGDLIIDYYVNTETTNYFGDEVEGIKYFTYSENMEGLELFLADWGADAETTERILADVSEWIEERSLSESGRLKREIADIDRLLKSFSRDLANYQKRQKRVQKEIDALENEKRDLTERIENCIERIAFHMEKRDEFNAQLEEAEWLKGVQ